MSINESIFKIKNIINIVKDKSCIGGVDIVKIVIQLVVIFTVMANKLKVARTKKIPVARVALI